jgi:hypothetical protein
MSGTSAKLIEFECRGCEFTEFDPDVFLFVDLNLRGNLPA